MMRTKFNIVLNKNKAKTYIQATYTHAKSYMEHVKTLKSEIPDKSERDWKSYYTLGTSMVVSYLLLPQLVVVFSPDLSV